MNELPDLPFEQVVSYLSLEDLIKSRAVSRAWYHRINSFRLKNLCFSQRPTGFIEGSRRLVNGAFAQNFISSIRFVSFCTTFRCSMLANLKHLRLCAFDLNERNQAAFRNSLNSFEQLQELDIIQSGADFGLRMKFDLNLPMLHSIHLNRVDGIGQLTLDAPRLKWVKLMDCNQLRVDLVHTEPVESLLVDKFEYLPVTILKNLRYLYKGHDYLKYLDKISRFGQILSSLKHLKEIHLDHLNGVDNRESISELFRQKRLSNRTQLKIYLHGLLLSGPDDPAIDSLRHFIFEETLRCLAENSSRLVDEIPLCHLLYYRPIERLAPSSEMSILKRFIDLRAVVVSFPIQDTQRFLNLLKNFHNIVELHFSSDQSQDLFDRLPEHCAVQGLTVQKAPSDFRFIFRLKKLIQLDLSFSIDEKTVRKILEELPFLCDSSFMCQNKRVSIKTGHLKPFEVTVEREKANVTDLEAVIQFIVNAPKW